MALALDLKNMNNGGLIRVIMNRGGDVARPGFVDISQLYRANYDHDTYWKIDKPLKIKNTYTVLEAIQPKDSIFIGLEDPDIINTTSGLDVYFTVSFLDPNIETGSKGWLHNNLFLGHASGSNLDDLTMKQPVLNTMLSTNSGGQQFNRWFKELCPAPINDHGFSYHLVESHDLVEDIDHSTIAVVKASSNDGPWKFITDVIHPAHIAKKYNDFANGDTSAYKWCEGHASPCRLLPTSFVNGKKYMVGIMNGRSSDTRKSYGRFLPGLFLYDINKGEVVWVDPQPLFDDPSARTIVFASEFIPPTINDNSAGILLAHLDDSQVYSYKITHEAIYKRLPQELIR